jgi:rubrerythrin
VRDVVPEEAAGVSQKLLEILDEAMEQERLAQKRYALGASLASDPSVKEMFLRLVEEEMGHERTLREWQLELREKG